MTSAQFMLNKQHQHGWNALTKRAGVMAFRMNLRVALGTLCAVVLALTLFWARCGELSRPPGSILSNAMTDRSARDQIECSINGEYSIACRRDRDDVYVPFNFIRKYFEIYGKVTSVDGVDKFEWSHSYSKVYHPKRRYDPRGTFTTFENYNVEVRDRVKCVSGIEGVPVSTQWEPRGFYYPTQIAQFGLSHYSKNLTEPEPRVRIMDDSDKHFENWIVSKDASISREFEPKVQSKVLRFSTSDQASSQVWLKVNISQDFVLSVDLLLKPNSSLTVVLQNKEKKETAYLHYVTNTQLIYAQEEHVYYGVGVEGAWRRLTRDLIVDMQKGWALLDRPKRKSPRNKFKISCMILSGVGALDNLTVSTSAHMEQFFAAARWLSRRQRARSGGWPIPVRRRIAPGVADLRPGWHSAMSQGHGISLLARAFHRSGDAAYLRAAKKALYLLDVPSHAGGVKALWMDKYVWYEEYPTQPHLFVLNGFIYALLGLYDLHAIEGENSISLAKKMFDDVDVSIDHSYSRKRKHEDHTYTKPADSTEETSRSPHARIQIENISHFSATDSSNVVQSSFGTSTRMESMALDPVSELQNAQTSKPGIQTPKRIRMVHKVKALSPTCKRIYTEFLKSKRQVKFSRRAKRALKFSKSDYFFKMTSQMNPLAKKIFWMQVKQCTKKIKGRRFSMDEKMIALSIMKQSPKCYRFLQRIFILPSKQTLNRMISNLKISPGINKQIFETMKNEITTWTEHKKYCSVIFDEVSLQPGLTYDKSRDELNGFVELTTKSNQFADHALTFMVRGAVHKWQQPIAFYFCEGATKRDQLKVILKDVVAAVVEAGLLPIALICDQGTSFQSALNSLLEDTRRGQVSTGGSVDRNECLISLSGQELVVVYDPPHLIKGIRNNFLTKNIVTLGKISRWSDIVDVYQTDCSHAQARLLHKLSDHHVLPNNINKMKVQNCTRVLSKTVAAALSYTSQFSHYSDGREVSPTLKNTAETVSFFDDLFDSSNGAALSHKRTKGKNLRRAVTQNSDHHDFWQDAIMKLQNIKFVGQESGQVTRTSVPSLKNWIVTLRSFQRLWQFFKSKNIKIMRPRYFNSDPIENFFGQVRAYNFRNNDPDCHTFTSTFRSLLITRFINFHSTSFNCESDSEEQLLSFENLFKETETQTAAEVTLSNANINVDNENILSQARRERLNVHSRAYTAGWLVRKFIKKVNCEACKACLTSDEGSIHNWISQREYNTTKKQKLTYPSEHAVRYFGHVVTESNEYLEKDPHKSNLGKNIKEQILNKYSFDFLNCAIHKTLVIEYFIALTVRFSIFNWSNIINKILRGTDVLRLQNKILPNMQQKAFDKFKTRLRNKKPK